MTERKRVRPAKKELSRLLDHYSGNCFSCERCAFYESITREEPGAVEAYVRYMAEERGEDVETVPA